MRYLNNILACLTLLHAGSIYAAADISPWQFSITPYIWVVNIKGDIEVGVPYEGVENQLIHLSEKFSKLRKHVHSGGMGELNASKGNFGVFVNAMYVDIRNLSVETSDGYDVLVNTKFSMYNAGISYRIYEYNINQDSKFGLEPIIGARYTHNTSGAFMLEMPEEACNYAADWTEPIIGAKLIFDINKKWSLNLSGDIGGIKKNQDSYSLLGLISYKPFKHFVLHLGYKKFYQYFTQGANKTYFYWKMHERGPIAGVSYRF